MSVHQGDQVCPQGREWWWPRCTICGRWMKFEEMLPPENPAEDYWPIMEHEACRG
jgi:hypothetical protein